VTRPRRLRGIIAVVLVAVGCTTVKMPEPRDTAREDPDAGAPAPDQLPVSEAPESVLVRFSDALAAGDSATIVRLASPEFSLLEVGHQRDLPSTITSLRKTLRGRAMERATREFDVSQRGEVAWARYKVRGLLRAPKSAVTFNRIESAVLVRDSSSWRISLMTSMPDSVSS
jgi:hypothetical protein